MKTKTEQPMRMLEEEALHRYCPLTLGTERITTCFGTKCMAWRWVGKQESDKPSEGFCGMSMHFPSR